MSNRLTMTLLMLTMLLVSCTSSATETPSATATQTKAVVATPETRQARCIAESRDVTPNPTTQALLPPIDATDWSKGPEDAHIQIVEYADFQ